MLRIGSYLFKRAETEEEFAKIHRLNYRIFVEEVRQHAANDQGLLVDKFHHKNEYLIALRDGELVGMISAHAQPPFSIAERLPDPALLQRPDIRPMEVRLLAVEPRERRNSLFIGLAWALYEHAYKEGFTHVFISGIEDRLDMYERIGFSPLGPAVPCGKSRFVPMWCKVGSLPVHAEQLKKQWEAHLRNLKAEKEPVCLLPGPVAVSARVKQAFHQPAIYHRGPEFIRRFVEVRRVLCAMAGGKEVAILNGSGTLANEAIAATLAAEKSGCRSRDSRVNHPPPDPCPLTHGLLLVNGEFGERLARQATRFGLRPAHLVWDWGQPWDLEQVDRALASQPPGAWVWGVHQESSTGMLNDVPGLIRLAQRRGARVCLDCISSLGAVPIDLRDVYLASSATGKSLGAFAGASLIFADRARLEQIDRSRIPSYLDIVAALDSQGPCFTFPSPTLLALEAALEQYATPALAARTYARYEELGRRIREELRSLDLPPLAAEEHACPVVTTFSPPVGQSSQEFVARCRAWGYAIGGESAYLSQRRYVQIATMGDIDWSTCAGLFEKLARHHLRRPGSGGWRQRSSSGGKVVGELA